MAERHDLTATSYRIYDWSLTLLIPTLVALAWGLARRSGRAWVAGVLVAPLLAGSTGSYSCTPPASSPGSSTMVSGGSAVLEFLAPMVAACVVCWLIEVSWPSPRIGDADTAYP